MQTPRMNRDAQAIPTEVDRVALAIPTEVDHNTPVIPTVRSVKVQTALVRH